MRRYIARLDCIDQLRDGTQVADDAALQYAEIRADLKKRGALIGANDLFIAAHARALGLVLVTNNTSEFVRVPALELENWVQSGE